MTVMTILTEGDPLLRKKSKPIDKITVSTKKLAVDMLETMYQVGGVGLAAPQIGVQKKIIVIDVSKDRNFPIVLINPKITTSQGKVISREGCLSCPGRECVVQRKERVTVIAKGLNGEQLRFEADGTLAICAQHEIDHLNGILIVDKMIEEVKEKDDRDIRES